MEFIFSIIGFIILGIFIRAIFNDKSIANKPKDKSEWVGQLFFSLLVGGFIWFCIPKSCKNSDRDYDRYDYQRLK